MSRPRKILILDGIGGVPLGQEICETFRELGIAAVHFDCLKQRTKRFHGIRSACFKIVSKAMGKDEFHVLPRLVRESIATLIESEAPSHIFVVGFVYKFIGPMDLRELADAAGAKLLLYDTDSCNLYAKRREFIYFVEQELPVYDEILSCSRVTANFFRETKKLCARHLAFGALPIDLVQGCEKDIDTLFVGSCDFRRILLLEAIRDHVHVFGSRWSRNFPLVSNELQTRIVDKPVWGNDLHALLARAKIILNITRSNFYGAETGINLRIFETVAAGCFLLTDYCEEIGEEFVLGEEIETFRCRGELADKVNYYLKNDDKRIAIARRGHERFLRDHTWRARLGRAFL
jgi:spore maturation protein CgeB